MLLDNQVALAKQNEQLRRQLAELQLMVKGMIDLQAKTAAPKEIRDAKAEDEKKQAAAASEQLKADADFGSEEGRKFREQLKKDAEFIKGKPITAETSREDIAAVTTRFKEAEERIRQEKAKWEREYREKREQILGTPIGKVVAGTITDEYLKRIGTQKLLAAVNKLDPNISAEEVARLEKDAAALYAKIRQYSAGGKWSPELVAALGDELAGLAGLPELPQDARDFINVARTAVDVHRSGADFASFATSTMEAALSTGNPYVIAAAAALILLIALFKALFGGGGGGGDGEGEGQGDGKGKGKGKGTVPGQNEDVTRNTGTGGGTTGPGGRPEPPAVAGTGGGTTSPGGQPEPPIIKVPDDTLLSSKNPKGDFAWYVQPTRIVVKKKQGNGFQDHFTVDLGKIVKAGTPFRVNAADLQGVSGDLNAKEPMLQFKNGGRVFLRPGASDNWLADDKEVTRIPISDPKTKGKYGAGRSGASLLIHDLETGKEVAKVDAGKVYFNDPADGGKRKVFGFNPTRVAALRSFNPGDKKIEITYPGKDGKPVDARLQPAEAPGEWTISGPLVLP